MTKELANKLDTEFSQYLNMVEGVFAEYFGEANVDLHKSSFADYIRGRKVGDLCNSQLGCLLKTHTDYSLEDLDDRTIETVLRETILLKNHTYNSIHPGYIYIHFPKETITNEHRDYRTIYHLYAKIGIPFSDNYVESIEFDRAEYTLKDIFDNYMHSHISGIPTINDVGFPTDDKVEKFLSPCFGDGPLSVRSGRGRIEGESYYRWLCYELSRFVRTESISGGPYKSLSGSLYNASRKLMDYSLNIPASTYLDLKTINTCGYFIPHLVRSEKLHFVFNNRQITIGMPLVEYLSVITTEYEKWYKTLSEKEQDNLYLPLKDYRYGLGYITIEGDLDQRAFIDRILELIKDRYVCTFKGQDIFVKISDLKEIEEEDKYIRLVEYKVAMYILSKILEVINCTC